jgi:hypothetical protein
MLIVEPAKSLNIINCRSCINFHLRFSETTLKLNFSGKMAVEVGNIPVQDNGGKRFRLRFNHALKQNGNGRSLNRYQHEYILDNTDIPLNVIPGDDRLCGQSS